MDRLVVEARQELGDDQAEKRAIGEILGRLIRGWESQVRDPRSGEYLIIYNTLMPSIETITVLPKLPPRALDANKGQFGRVLVVAGSRGMSGAAILCGGAALRAGAGLVKVAVPEGILPIVAAGNPCYTTSALSQDGDGRIAASALATLTKLADSHDVLAVGPGLDRSTDLSKCMADLVAAVAKPLVIDADGLNAFVGQADKLRGDKSPRLITPHPGEFARLLNIDVKAVQSKRRELAAEFAGKQNLIVVLKGQGTIVTDGKRVYQNTTGNPGMATGGTGDVLTGIIAALLGQHLPPFEAAQLGVYVHGLAGDLARDQIGEVSLIASDLLDFLPAALRQSC
jgi:NAD(P)H-hydrate epimerase